MVDAGRCLGLVVGVLGAAAGVAGAAQTRFRKVDHPFIMWTRADLDAIRRRIDAQPWARAAYERLADNPDPLDRVMGNLLRLALSGDRKLAEAEKKELLRVIRSPVPLGGAQWPTILRYDLLYHELTDAERGEFDRAARLFIDQAIFKRSVFDPNVFNDSARYSRYDAKVYTRSNWLPNIIWPRKVSANLFAAALRDEDLIRRTWAAYGSWKWYFDEYLADEGFYCEEFSKMGSTPGEMLMYCRAVEHLGLDELGFGYVGKGSSPGSGRGATMKGHIASLIHLGYPRIDVGSDRPQYPMVTMGDLRQVGSSQAWNLPSPAFQHSLVCGYAPEGTGGDVRWRAHGAWGGLVRGRSPQWDGYGNFTPKMQLPFWFEAGQARWPDVGFGYFLAQMRAPGQDLYTPSLYFGIEPIDPAGPAARPPPAPSAVWPQRGLVMLRAEESPAYWASPAPAAAMRLASSYAHNVNDSFALLGYYAFNRPIYLNRQVTPGYAEGWCRSIQSHCGLKIDQAEPRFSSATAVRHAFVPLVKFAAAHSTEVYPGIGLTRALFLTREYLMDVIRAAPTPGGDGEEHEYYWFIHALGVLRAAREPHWQGAALPAGLVPLADTRRFDASDAPWRITVDQICALEDPAKARLPKAWYDRRIGVTMRMLGEGGTTVYAARTPLPLQVVREDGQKPRQVEQPSEVGGVTVIVSRKARAATFAALHEPFEGAAGPGRLAGGRVAEFRRLAQTDEGLAVAVGGGGLDDRIMLRFAGDAKQPLTLAAADGESFTFTDYAFIRASGQEDRKGENADRIDVVCGALSGMKLRIGERPGPPKLFVNGVAASVRLGGGFLILEGM